MLVKNGLVVNGSGTGKWDIRIEGEKITQLEAVLEPQNGEEVLDASGYIVVPGGIDAHTHFDMPCGSISTSDDFYSGTRAAVAGGTTTVIDFQNQNMAPVSKVG